LVVSQCELEGKTFNVADGRSLTFGKAVGEWIPGILNLSEGSLSFTTWTQETATRWNVKDFGSTDDWFCGKEAQYTIEFFNACAEIHFTVLHDICGDRTSFLSNVFTLDDTTDGDCLSTGTELPTRLSESKDYPRLSGDSATVVFGANNYALVSVSNTAVIVQRWRSNPGTVEDEVHIVDLASHPEGFACSGVDVGNYLTKWDEDTCQGRLCFSEDACAQRLELFHNIGLNDFEGDFCSRDLDNEVVTEHCSTGKQWLRHPDDCVAQDVPGGCMYCAGIAMGETTTWCLDRQGAGCEQVFGSSVRQAYCNLQFECPAVSVGASLVMFICSLLALFLR